MKSTPIIICQDLMPATLDGRKTMTRRTKGLDKINENPDNYKLILSDGKDLLFRKMGTIEGTYIKCPFGQVGDELWIKERLNRKGNSPIMPDYITYNADLSPVLNINPNEIYPELSRPTWLWQGNVLSSMFMPKWACRRKKIIKSIRCERVQDITEEDILKEGVMPKEYLPWFTFKELWDKLNAKRGHPWEKNDWVWVLEW